MPNVEATIFCTLYGLFRRLRSESMSAIGIFRQSPSACPSRKLRIAQEIRSKLLYVTRFLFICYLMLIVSPCALIQTSAQIARGSGTRHNEVVLSKLSSPLYPPMARQARVTGDVHLILGIGRNGSIESAVVVSGHPMLQKVALQSAQQSQFECRGCSEPVTSYAMFYTFEIVGKCCIATDASDSIKQEAPSLGVTQWQNHVTVVAEPACLCGADVGIVPRKVRSAKCLYLWRCSLVKH